MESIVLSFLEQFYDKPVVHFNRKEGGVVNHVFSYKVEGKSYIIKILTRKPNDEYERLRFKKVKEILLRATEEADIPIPQIYHLEIEKTGIGLSYLIMEEINGEVLENGWKALSITEKKSIINQLGVIAGKIHSIKLDHYGEILLLAKKRQFKTWKEYIQNEITLSIKSLEKDKTISYDILQKAKLFTEQNIDVITNLSPQLIHGDLNFTNLFFTTNSTININGVIDWEWCFSGSSKFEYYDILETLQELEQKDEIEHSYVDYFLETYPKKLHPDPDLWPIEERLYLLTKRLSCAAFGYVHHNPSLEYREWIEKDVLKAVEG